MPPVTRPLSPPASDPVLETQVFWEKYRSQILLAIAVVLLAGALIGGYALYVARRNATAAGMLAVAKTPSDYQKIFSDYPATGAAASAYLLLAEAQQKEQKPAEANATLKAFVDKNPKHEFVATAKMAMAGNLESLGKPDESIQLYREIAAAYPRNFNAPFALLAQVHFLKQKGQTEEARRVCETVLTQYRESYASAEASRYLRMLKPAAPAAVAAPVSSPAPATAATP